MSKGVFQEKLPSTEKALSFRHFITFFNNNDEAPAPPGDEEVICFGLHGHFGYA